MLNFFKIPLTTFLFIFLYSLCQAGVLTVSEELSEKPVTSENLSKSAENISPLERRISEEEKLHHSSFSLAPHRQNYFLFFNYNSDPNTEIYENTGQEAPKNYEAKFQISFKVLT